ncbi:MAG: helix-turn-helix transcriptional regulator [Salibacteraceae bacterium]
MASSLGYKIKKIRELKNLTQGFMSDELGISQAAYSKIERGETEISFENVERIANILGMSLNDLIAFDEQVIFNVSHNQTAITTNSVLYQNNSESKQLHEKMALLERELACLKEIIELLRTKN